VICVSVNSSNSLVYEGVADTCPNLALVTSSELSSVNNLSELMEVYFAFDSALFGVIEGALITAFLTSHFAGRVVRWLGKS